jgi:antitoxin component YwqK of YwqJK toxin-antitoxin module
MKNPLIILSLFIFASCSPEVPLNDLSKIGGLYYTGDSPTPFTGNAVSFFENGQLKSKTNYKDGNIVGLTVSYYENGNLRSQLNYKDGKRDGFYKIFKEDESDSLESWYCYKDDEEVNIRTCLKK